MRKKKKTSQTEWVLNYLRTHKRGLNPLQAFKKKGISRLGGLIFDLRHGNEGHRILVGHNMVRDHPNMATYFWDELT